MKPRSIQRCCAPVLTLLLHAGTVDASPDDNPMPAAAPAGESASAAPTVSTLSVAVSFEQGAYTAPPRSLTDITYQLGQVQAPWDCEKDPPIPMGELYSIASSASGAGGPSWTLAKFARYELANGNIGRATELTETALDSFFFNSAKGKAQMSGQLARIRAAAGDLDGARSAAGRAGGVDPHSRAMSRHGNAAAEQLAGNLAEAGALLRDAKQQLSNIAAYGGYDYIVDVDIAENLLLQGRYNEAELAVRELLSEPSALVWSFTRAKSLLLLARIMLEQGRFADAETVAKAAINAYLAGQARCESLYYNVARLVLAEAQTAQGRYTAAIREFDTIARELAIAPVLFDSHFAGSVGWGIALLGAGRPDDARQRFAHALAQESARFGDESYAAAESRGLLGAALGALGQREAARAEFERAMPILTEHANAAQPGALATTLRDLRLGVIVEHYLEHVAATGGERAASDAFRAADVARGRSVQRAIVASSLRAAASDPALSELVRKGQEAGREAGLVFDALTLALAQPPGEIDRALVARLEQRLRELERIQTENSRSVAARFPRYADLVNPKPPTIDDVRAALAPDEAMVATFSGREHTFVWAFRGSGPIAFHAAPLGAEALADAVGLLRSALEPQAEVVSDIPDFDVASAHQLYRDVLEPVRAGFEGASTLVAIPHGALASLPLSVLVTEPPRIAADTAGYFSRYRSLAWLGMEVSTAYVPTGASFVAMRRSPPTTRPTEPLAAFADPVFSAEPTAAPAVVPGSGQIAERGKRIARRSVPLTRRMNSATLAALPPLPDTRDEVEAVARSLGADRSTSIFLGAAANEEMVKSVDLSNRRVVVFATHGLAAGDLDGLYQPALALSSPAASKTEGDGLLAMGEILGLRLGADWVVLSACNTAAGDGAGAEAASGLGRAFLFAGARSVLVTHWPVETTSATALTSALFRTGRGTSISRADALREAIAWMIAEGQTEHFTYAHPLFWAPFTLIGDGAR